MTALAVQQRDEGVRRVEDAGGEAGDALDTRVCFVTDHSIARQCRLAPCLGLLWGQLVSQDHAMNVTAWLRRCKQH